MRYDDLDFSIDISRMKFPDDFFEKMQPQIDKAFRAMRELEAGAIANPDEKRMVGHYWLRNPALAPNAELRADIEETNKRHQEIRRRCSRRKDRGGERKKFAHVLLIGIGGSALGPQFVADALGSASDPMDIYFFDNTDPDGFDRVLAKIGDGLAHTLVVVISKSGGTKETRNGMLEAEARFENGRTRFRQTCGRRDRRRKRAGQTRGEERLAGAVSDARLGRRPHLGDERGRPCADGAAGFRHRRISGRRGGDGRADARDRRAKTPPCCSR